MTNDDRDPLLLSLFTSAQNDLEGHEFAGQVMLQLGISKRKAVMGWSCIGLVLALCVVLLSSPLQQVVQLLTLSVSLSLIDVDHRLLAEIISPMNNMGSLLALALFGLRIIYRKVFRF